MTAMRIGIDYRAFQYVSRYLGIGTYSANLLDALHAANGHHALVPFAHARSGPNGDAETSFDRLVDQRGFRITGPRSLRRQVVSHRLDLCHVLEILPPFAAAERTVVTVYDLIPLIFPKVYLSWRGLPFRWGLRAYYRFVRKARRIIAISEHTKADLQQILGVPSEQIVVIYPGVSPAFRPLEAPARLAAVMARYGIRSPFMLYVGSCDYRKNVPGLLRAFAAFRTRGQEAYSLVLVGKDIEFKAERLRQQGAALGIAEALHLVGYVPLDDLVALYNAATMFVFPSWYEGFGFPPVEAMACGTPVITSNTSSLREVADGSALLVDPHDDHAVADAMHRLALDRGLRETLRRRGPARAQHFQWAQAAQRILAVYEQCGARARA